MTTDVRDPGPGGVPVEHRWLGLDRRTVGPSLVVLVISLLLIYGWQGLNAVIPWHNETQAGDVVDLGSATVVPPVGWQLESGSLVGGPRSASAVLSNGGTTVSLQVRAYAGTAAGFLDQVQRSEGTDPSTAAGSRQTLITGTGLVGVVQGSTSTSGDELAAAFKLASGGGAAVRAAPALLVEVNAAPGQFERDRGTVTELLRSVSAVNQ